MLEKLSRKLFIVIIIIIIVLIYILIKSMLIRDLALQRILIRLPGTAGEI